MKRIALAVVASSLALGACGTDKEKETVVVLEPAKDSNNHARDQVYWFSGHIYDGVTGSRLTRFSLDLQYKDVTVAATVAEDGRYVVGPLPYFQDYTIRIRAEGYRTFLSHNEGMQFDWPVEETLVGHFAPEKGFYYNAFLYPAGVQAPGTQVYVTLTDSTAKPTQGTVRLTPSSSPALLEGLPAVNGQVWMNSDDLQLRSISKPIVNGVATVEAGELGYGVPYDVTVYGVPGYIPTTTVLFGGIESVITASVDPIQSDSLDLVYRTTDPGMAIANGEVTFVFNRPIEWVPTHTAAEYARMVDQALTIWAPDANGNGTTTQLKPSTDERGTAVEIRENLLTIRWNQTMALATFDDPILELTYGNLYDLEIQPAGSKDPGKRTSVGSLNGSDSVWVTLR